MSQRKVVDLKNFAKELGVWSDNAIKDLRDATARGVSRSIPDLVAASPVDTGLYAQSWDMSVEETAVILGNYAPYAGVIEYGARPFTPPIGPLLQWAKRVLQSKSQPLNKQDVESSGKNSLSGYDSDVWALAISVQKKIQERGIPPRHIMENAIPGIMKRIKEEMEKL